MNRNSFYAIHSLALVVVLLVLNVACQLPAADIRIPATATGEQATTPEANNLPTLPIIGTSTITATINFQARDDELIACPSLAAGESRSIAAGAFLIGDVVIEGVPHAMQRNGESTVTFVERDTTVIARAEVRCTRGSIYLLNNLVQEQFENGCDGECAVVRIIVVPAEGAQQIQCRYADGTTHTLQPDANALSCP